MTILHIIWDTLGTIVALGLLLMIAFPKHFTVPYKPAEKVGPTYWGAYKDTPTTDKPDEVVVQPPEPAAAGPIVTGSAVYEMGRKMSASGTFKAQ